MVRGLALLALGLVVACTPAATHKIITAADLADPVRTRISSSLKAPLREGSSTEETPSTVKPEAVADEALIRKLTPNELCVDLVVRHALALDAPLEAWRITLNGQPVKINSEKVSVRDYPATGEPPVEVVANLTQEAFAARRIGEPKEIAFRVVERRASGCFPRGADKRLVLKLTLPAADGKGDWGMAFDWHVQ